MAEDEGLKREAPLFAIAVVDRLLSKNLAPSRSSNIDIPYTLRALQR